MTTGMLSSGSPGSAPAKEATSLPAPATMPDNQLEPATVGQKLVWLLHYLNPLFYARLAQSLVSSVLESYWSAGNAEGHAGRQISAPVPADATAIDCGYERPAAGDVRVSHLPQVDLDHPVIPPIETSAFAANEALDEPAEAVPEPKAASPPSPASAELPYSDMAQETAQGPDTEPVDSTAQDPADDDDGNASAAADPAAAPKGTGKKGKRGKKGKGRTG
ncbi:hypothetical protein H4R18_000053 [Coemansia javaensis]|uniref:Uncharacterized protein n=1 Tax=Coemansia javaensis TaxID=2761396 RepID=A0A9W8LMA0_9FUNG|nr:hypothetical protein H4R18_000053 [Coemansia javaensis]